MPELASGGAVAARDALREALLKPLAGEELTRDEAVALLATPELTAELLATAGALRDGAWGRTVTFSPKVFLPITNLCRDRCTYCTFRKDPDDPDAWTMTPDEIAAWSVRGRRLGCKEALLCLGDKPEVAFPAYRATLARLGHRSTAEYVHRAATIALDAGLLPHTNAGLLTREEMARLKDVNVSLGLMLENVSPRLRGRGEVHQWAPDKEPALRLRMLLASGLNDWGGISPLTPDYVNPEAPWPHVAALAAECRAAGYQLRERLAIYPTYIDRPGWLAPALRPRLAALAAGTDDAAGVAEVPA